jgi:hypothetical protein
MGGRATSRALATFGLAFCFYYATWRWPWLLVIFYPVVGPMVLAALLGAQALVMRRLPPDPVSRALDIMAGGLLVVPVLALPLQFLAAGDTEVSFVEGCGAADATAMVWLLKLTWPVLALGEALVLVTIARRRDELRSLPWHGSVATVCTLFAGPPLALVTALVVAQESGAGGPGAVVFYPAAIAACGTILAWAARRRWPALRALRTIAGGTVVLGVTIVWPTLRALGFGLGLPLALFDLNPGVHRCASFWDSPNWSLVSIRHPGGWLLVVMGVLLVSSRNPE